MRNDLVKRQPEGPSGKHLEENLEYVFYDNACALARHARHPMRATRTAAAVTLAGLTSLVLSNVLFKSYFPLVLAHHWWWNPKCLSLPLYFLSRKVEYPPVSWGQRSSQLVRPARPRIEVLVVASGAIYQSLVKLPCKRWFHQRKRGLHNYGPPNSSTPQNSWHDRVCVSWVIYFWDCYILQVI